MSSQNSTIPEQRTLALVNNYVVHTSQMLNNLATSCEAKLQDISEK